MSDEPVWPDNLSLGDRIEFRGTEYVVVGTGPGEATLDPADGNPDGAEMKVFRWALIDAVGIELETTVTQEEFDQMVRGDRDE